jgi:hypothetical protein
MGSYPRREKAERLARERADTVPVLDCQSCGALTPGDHSARVVTVQKLVTFLARPDKGDLSVLHNLM